MNQLLLLVLLAVASCTAYDFTDSSFNEIILDEFKELRNQLDDPDPLRIRRDVEDSESEHCMQKRLPRVRCCNDKINLESYERYRQPKKECFTEIIGEGVDINTDPFNCNKWKELKNQVVCMSECVGRKFELVDDNGNLIREALVEHMKTKFSEPDDQWKLDVAEEIVDKCLGQVSQSSEDSSSEFKCNPAVLKVVHCIWAEYVKACPKELQIESKKCNRLRERLESDDKEMMRAFFFPRFHIRDEKK